MYKMMGVLRAALHWNRPL